MSTHFHSLQVKEIRKETNDCVTISFDLDDTQRSIFKYTQGQYITLRKTIGDQDIRRSYSICSSPLDNELVIAIKKAEKGIFSTYANESLKKGDTLEVMPPMGNFFTPLNPASSHHYVGFAAGSGITPLLSIIKTTLLTEPKSRFLLVYGNKTRHSIIFKEQLEALKNLFLSRFSIIYVLSREKTDSAITAGRIDAEICKLLFEKYIPVTDTAAYFLCGPADMVLSVKEALVNEGVEKQKIHVELFSAPGEKKYTVQAQAITPASSPISDVRIRLDGISFDFTLAYHGQSILDAALAEGADLPYACKGGVCCTCRAKLLEGKVNMDMNYGLEADEIEQGFILTCQSHPQSAKVVIDFDSK